MSSGGDAPNTQMSVEDYLKLYQGGIDVSLSNLPRLLDAERAAREGTDPERIEAQQLLQELYGPTMYRQQLDALHQLDPESERLRKQLADAVGADLARGTELSPDLQRQFQSSFRGGQAARGNILGTSNAIAESTAEANLGQQLYQQRLENVGKFLSGPTPEQQLLAVQGVQPDRSMAYVNPSAGIAGANFGLQNYQNLLAGQQLQQNNNPWGRALGGAASGAAAGSAFGPYGALIGGVAGAGLGYFSSDIRLKENIETVGESPSGLPIKEFSYKDDPQKKRFMGVIAQDVQSMRPDAVHKGEDGMLFVDYSKIDVLFLELNNEHTGNLS